MARPRRRRSSNCDTRTEGSKRRRVRNSSGSTNADADDHQEPTSPSSIQSDCHSIETTATSSSTCSFSSEKEILNLQDPVNDNVNGREKEEEEKQQQTFPDFLLAGLQSDNTDLVIQAVHDIAVRVQQMEDTGLQETAKWVLETLYSNMDDDKALGLLKQEVLVVVAVALHSTHNNSSNDDDDDNNNNNNNNNKESTGMVVTESHESSTSVMVSTPVPLS